MHQSIVEGGAALMFLRTTMLHSTAESSPGQLHPPPTSRLQGAGFPALPPPLKLTPPNRLQHPPQPSMDMVDA